ncbi:hypothetical protein KBI5_21125 [Frankia sp. KB5]|nr:hypothetical protein KBI5_21125 [Frankia sp. KB5]
MSTDMNRVEIIDADEIFPWLVVRTTDEADARAAAAEWVARDPYGYFTGDPKPTVGNLQSGIWRWIPNRSNDAACTKWLVTAKPGRGAFHGFRADLNWAPAGGA